MRSFKCYTAVSECSENVQSNVSKRLNFFQMECSLNILKTKNIVFKSLDIWQNIQK